MIGENDGSSVGCSEGEAVGDSLELTVGSNVEIEGAIDGFSTIGGGEMGDILVGAEDGGNDSKFLSIVGLEDCVSKLVGGMEGSTDGLNDGESVGRRVGFCVGGSSF